MKRAMWIISIVMTLLPAGLALACPLCKDSIPNSNAPSPSSLSAGFNLSIYTMFMGLLIALGVVGNAIRHGIRDSNARMESENADE